MPPSTPTSVEHSAEQVSDGAAEVNGQARDGAQYSDYFDLISGEHAADWLGVDKWKRLSTVFGPDKAREIMTWYRTNMAYHARFLVDENGTPRGALLDELLAIPFKLIRDDPRAKSAPPTRQQVKDFTAAADWRRDLVTEVNLARSVAAAWVTIPSLWPVFGADDPRVGAVEAALADRLVLHRDEQQQKKAQNPRYKPTPAPLEFSGEELIDFGFTAHEIHLLLLQTTEGHRRGGAAHRADLEAAEQKRARDAGNAMVAATAAADIELPPTVSMSELLAADDPVIRHRIENVWPDGGARIMLAAPDKAGKTTMIADLSGRASTATRSSARSRCTRGRRASC